MNRVFTFADVRLNLDPAEPSNAFETPASRPPSNSPRCPRGLLTERLDQLPSRPLRSQQTTSPASRVTTPSSSPGPPPKPPLWPQWHMRNQHERRRPVASMLTHLCLCISF